MILPLYVFTVKTCLRVLVSRFWLIIMFHCDESIFLHTLNAYLRPHVFIIENVRLDATLLQPMCLKDVNFKMQDR